MLPRILLATACLALIATGIALNWRSFSGREPAQVVDFNRDIRPILNQNCTSCHGGVKQAENVSFIYREEALGKGKSGRPTVVPRRPNASELITRVTSRDPNVRMPLHGQPLSTQQIDLLKQWIKEGAQWQDYWAFVPPKPQALPPVKQKEWIRRPLDNFILAKLEKEGLHPSPEADKSTLLRRASFDLTGLPPTPEEVSTFLADASPDAYEKQVDRLLESPRYGERWAALWLDLARYADSKGYEQDLPRPGVWPYRDWVIDAFNRNLPYDKFLITQLAGDLLPHATFEDLIATSFHRQTPGNDEGGTDDEEFRLAAVMDRVATTWSVLNGVTMNCVQCHSHPYDPIHHDEYYKFLDFFNTSQDADLPTDAPTLRVPRDKSYFEEASRLQGERNSLRRKLTDRGRALAEDEKQWRQLPITTTAVDEVAGLTWQFAQLKAGVPSEGAAIFAAAQDMKLDKAAERVRKQLLQNVLDAFNAQIAHAKERAGAAEAPSLSIKDGEAWTSDDTPMQSVYDLTMSVSGSVLTALRVEAPPVDAEKARHTPELGFFVDRLDAWILGTDGNERKIAFKYFVADSEPNLARALREDHGTLVGAFAANSKLFRTCWMVGIPESPLDLAPGSLIKVRLTQTQTLAAKPAIIRRVRFTGSADPKWTEFASSSSLLKDRAELAKLERRLAEIPSANLPFMAESPAHERRETFEFERGNFLTKTGPLLAAGVPKSFPKLPAGAPRNRLAMAEWFFAPDQPLTARVAVNRFWEQLFGLGIVETLEDFGSAGEAPSHPELLDWLALHFQNGLRWDMKAFLQEVVTSATYRQSARMTPLLRERDPRNRLLARGPQQRLTAEMVRDQALMASGLLTATIGGPPVMPPQPASVSMENFLLQWVDATGPDRYRRALYIHLKRNNIYPTLVTFDGSVHDVSLPRRIPTNTPLQALVTLNDPVYHEAAQALAKRMTRAAAETGAEPIGSRIIQGVKLVLSRDPTAGELEALHKFYDRQLSAPVSASGMQAGADRSLLAMTSVAAVLLNLDAAMTR